MTSVERSGDGRDQPIGDFSVRHRGKDLRKKSVRAGAVTLGSQAAQFVLQTASTAVLARLLVPSDFGLIAMAVAVTAFAQVFKDVGLSTATIQRSELTHGQVSIMFWLNTLVGLILTLMVSGIAPFLVWFYRKPELLWVTIGLSTSFFINSLGIQHSALLKREMRFRALAITQVGGMAVGVVAAILAAMAGWGYWALLVKVVVNATASVVLLWGYSKWRPSWPARATGTRSLFRFGANVTGFNVVNYFSRNLDNILIGRVWGAEALGLYSRAYALLMLPINNLRNPLNAVAFPTLSRLVADTDRFRRFFSKYISILAFASMPGVALLFICSDNIILLLLGKQWTGASAIFQILAVTAFIQPVASTRGLVILSTGQSRRYLQWGVMNAILAVAAFGIGVYWGAVGVAAAYGIVNYLALYPTLRICYKGTPVCVRDFFASIARAGTASILAGVVTYLTRYSLPQINNAMTLLFCGAIFLVFYFLIFLAIPGGGAELREYWSFRAFFSAGKPQTQDMAKPVGGAT